ncbi:MAG: potassium transporter [Epsilonproteobacteria bacterium]|nr:potassium transporter [Campylobacterota bacterium]NPA64614.1 potassium transporter [Campylobacterota bacterium]
MDIIIAGAGRVGYRLAETLSLKHNVYIIDKNAEALSRLGEAIDILPILGDIEDPDTYKALQEKEFDIFIAVTDSDEANILSTLIAAESIEAQTKIIRLRNPFFAKSSIAQKLEITQAVFPFVDTAKSIAALLDYPKANNVKSLPFSDFKLISLTLNEPLFDSYAQIESQQVRVVGVERNKELLFTGDAPKSGDLVYLFGQSTAIKKLCQRIDAKNPPNIKRVAIFGADLLGLEIAKIIKDRVALKLIEEDPALCERAAETLQNSATIINSKYIEHKLFEEENIKAADMTIATYAEDEANIVKSLEAKEYGVQKCVAINNDTQYYDLMHKLSIIPIRGPKSSAYYAIVEKIGSSAIIAQKHYCGGRGALFVRKIFEGSKLIERTVKPPNVLGRYFIQRGDEIVTLHKNALLRQGDIIVAFTLSLYEEEIKRWIENL